MLGGQGIGYSVEQGSHGGSLRWGQVSKDLKVGRQGSND